jgi:hypothetical protein
MLKRINKLSIILITLLIIVIIIINKNILTQYHIVNNQHNLLEITPIIII